MAKEITTAVVVGRKGWDWSAYRLGQGRPARLQAGQIDIEGVEPVVIEAAIKEMAGGRAGDIVVGMSLDQVLLRVLELPMVDEDELADMVELQVDKFSPFPVENMVVSHEILSRSEEEDTCQVLAAAVKRSEVQAIGEQLAGMGRLPVRVDALVLAWLRLLRDASEIRKAGRQVLVLMAGGSPEVIVTEEGQPIAFRSLGELGDLSGDELADEISREVGYTLMTLELERGSATASVVSVWHEGDAPEELIPKLRAECSCDVELKQLSELPPVQEGLVLRSVNQGVGCINLVLPDWQHARVTQQFRRKLGAVAIALASVWLLVLLGLFGGLFYEKYVLAGLERELATVEGPAQEVRNTQRRVRTLEMYTDASQSALTCLHEISRLEPMPRDAIEWRSYDYRKERMVRLEGYAASDEVLLEYNRNLSKSKIFTKVALGDRVRDPRSRKIKFSMTLDLPGGEVEE